MRKSEMLRMSAVGLMLIAGCSCLSTPSESGEGPPKMDAGVPDVGGEETVADLGAGPVCGSCELTADSLCTCGALGCPCGDGDSCSEGVCNPNSCTCVLEEDEMVFVPQGPFWMGCRDEVDTDEITGPCEDDFFNALPYKEVTLDAFWIDKHEVTKAAYRECLEAGACSEPYLWDEEWYMGPDADPKWVPAADDMPAASVNWTQAKTYCEWAGKRLPTEAEWEKTARGTDGRKYPWGFEEITCEHANHARWDVENMTLGEPCAWKDQYGSLTPVGWFPKGTCSYGALDMVGNVSEWVNDGYQSGVGYEGLPDENPTGVESDDSRVFRGSSWQTMNLTAGGYALRVSLRGVGGLSAQETLTKGIRCAKSPS